MSTYCDNALDSIFERALAKMWEEQTEPIISEEKAKKIEPRLRHALSLIETALWEAEMVVEALEDNPMGDRVASIMDEIEDVSRRVKDIQKEMGVN